MSVPSPMAIDANPQAGIGLELDGRVLRADAEAAHVDAVRVLGPRRPGRGEVVDLSLRVCGECGRGRSRPCAGTSAGRAPTCRRSRRVAGTSTPWTRRRASGRARQACVRRSVRWRPPRPRAPGTRPTRGPMWGPTTRCHPIGARPTPAHAVVDEGGAGKSTGDRDSGQFQRMTFRTKRANIATRAATRRRPWSGGVGRMRSVRATRRRSRPAPYRHPRSTCRRSNRQHR